MMKSYLSISILTVLVACGASSPDPQPHEIVGADRTEEGCISSAGYQWSSVLGECVRIWEVGTELTHQGSGDPDFSAFAITTEGAAEIYLPETEGSLRLARDVGSGEKISWTDTTSEYSLTYDADTAMILTDLTGFIMYKDMSVQPVFDDIPPHAEDEIGGDIVMGSGRVTQVEDGVYPMYTIHLRLDNETEDTVFSLMAESAIITGASVHQLEDRPVKIEYVERDLWDLVHIQPIDAEPMDDIEIGEGWRFVTGRLQGASDVSGGDLPDTLWIEIIDGDFVEFDLYIDEAMVALNNQDVTAWLAPRHSKDLLTIDVEP